MSIPLVRTRRIRVNEEEPRRKVRRLVAPNLEEYERKIEDAEQKLGALQEEACSVHSELQQPAGKLRRALDSMPTLKEMFPMEDFSTAHVTSCYARLKAVKAKAKSMCKAFNKSNKCALCELNGTVTKTSFTSKMMWCCYTRLCDTCIESLPVKMCEAFSNDDLGPTSVRLELTRACPFCRGDLSVKKVINCVDYAFYHAREDEGDVQIL